MNKNMNQCLTCRYWARIAQTRDTGYCLSQPQIPAIECIRFQFEECTAYKFATNRAPSDDAERQSLMTRREWNRYFAEPLTQETGE